MHPQSLLVVATLLSRVLAAAVDIQRLSFAVERVANPGFAGNNGPRALVKSYRKLGVTPPRTLLDAAETRDRKAAGRGKRSRGGRERSCGGNDAAPAGRGKAAAGNQTGSVEAVPVRNDVEFVSRVQIGGQALDVLLDTGSADLWVLSSQLGDTAATAGHAVYNTSRSATLRPIEGAAFRIQYGDGSGAEGTVGTDVVSVGGVSFADQAVGLATAVTASFLDDQASDGILGLAFSVINSVRPHRQRTFFDNVKAQLAEPVFVADLRRGQPGTYTFGRVDASRFRGPLAWVSVDAATGFWKFPSERFAIGGAAASSNPGGRAFVDTGTSLLLADEPVVAAYYARVPGARKDLDAGGFTFPCKVALPDLSLDVGGVYMATVSGHDVNFSSVDDHTCFGGLQATPPGQAAIYGDIFFKSQFVVFNAGNNSLGMAPHA